MIEVQLRQYLIDFQEKFKTALLKHELYGISDFDDLLSSLATVVTSAKDNEELFIPIEEHKLDKFGLSEQAVRLANAGYSDRKMSEVLSLMSGSAITETEIREWFTNYSSLSMIRKPKIHANLFDVQERMQDVYMALMDHLETIQNSTSEDFWKAKTTKQQVILDVYKELRFLTKDAKSIIDSIDHQQKLNEFRKLVIETIRKIDPTTARIIIEKLQQDKAIYTALLPPD